MIGFTSDVLLNILLACCIGMFVLGVALAALGAWLLLRPDNEEVDGYLPPVWHPDHPERCTDDTAWRDFEILTAGLPEPRRLSLRRRQS